jgi:HSP20 family molecular chaperone IbpA
VDGAKIKAEFGSGILTVHLPKVAAAKPNSRKIEVVEKK